MKTSKPISTISYLSEPFLRAKLEELEKQKVIEFWCYIRHKPEDDESKLKKHAHLYIIPAKMIQTVELMDALKEFDPKNPDKPLGVINFKNSKRFGDWCLYCLHDKAYLASKGQARKYHYEYKDFVASNQSTLDDLYESIDLMEVSKYNSMLEAQEKGLSWPQYFSRGTIPVQQIGSWKEAWYTVQKLRYDKLERNFGDTHTPITPEDILDDYIALCREHNMTDEEIYECFANFFRKNYRGENAS